MPPWRQIFLGEKFSVVTAMTTSANDFLTCYRSSLTQWLQSGQSFWLGRYLDRASCIPQPPPPRWIICLLQLSWTLNIFGTLAQLAIKLLASQLIKVCPDNDLRSQGESQRATALSSTVPHSAPPGNMAEHLTGTYSQCSGRAKASETTGETARRWFTVALTRTTQGITGHSGVWTGERSSSWTDRGLVFAERQNRRSGGFYFDSLERSECSDELRRR